MSKLRYAVNSMNPPELLGEYTAKAPAEERYQAAIEANPARPVQLLDRETREVLAKSY